MTNDIDAYLFDLGQVVIKIEFDRAITCWARHAGCDARDISTRFSLDESYERHETGEIDASDYFESLRSSLGINLTDDQFLEGWNSIFAGPIPGIEQLLAEVSKEKPVYAFSNSNLAHECHWSVDYGALLDPFEHIFVSSTIGMRKPDPAAFLYVSDKIGLPPQRIHFFDDLLENVEAARALGFPATHVKTGTCARQAIAAT